jgi:hypothetical protein
LRLLYIRNKKLHRIRPDIDDCAPHGDQCIIQIRPAAQ